MALLLDHNLPPNLDNLEGANYYLEKVCDKAQNNLTLKISHIKVSLHVDDEVDNEKFTKIGKDVLSELDYIDTPYLIWSHLDSHHPHIHIITTNINNNGKHISSSNEGYKSNKVEKELEERYNLITKLSRQEEYQGMRTKKSWPEQQIANKTGYDTDKNVIRNYVASSYHESIDSLELFAKNLSRSGIQLHISKHKGRDQQDKYGFSYTLDPKKINFGFSSEVNTMPSEFRKTALPDSYFNDYQNNELTGFIMGNPNKKNEELAFNFSKNVFNEIYIADDELVHPEPMNLKKISMRGSDIGSGFSYYALQQKIGFTDEDAEEYRAEGNNNKLNESPEMTKLLYSMIRSKKDCVTEAFEEGASLNKIESSETAFYMENHSNYWNMLLVQEREVKEKILQKSLSSQKDKDKSIKKENEPTQQKKAGWNFFK